MRHGKQFERKTVCAVPVGMIAFWGGIVINGQYGHLSITLNFVGYAIDTWTEYSAASSTISEFAHRLIRYHCTCAEWWENT